MGVVRLLVSTMVSTLWNFSKSVFLERRKPPAASLRTKNLIFHKKKGPAASLRTKNLIFHQKKRLRQA